MDSDEDICVLQYSDNDEDNHNNDKDITVDAAGTNLFFPFVPISAHTPADNDRDFGSHEALKIAFTTLKQKLNDTKAHNQQLVEKVRELESSKLRVGSDLESFAVIGESFDMMEDVRYAAESGTSTQPTGNMLVGPGEGFPANNNLHRQMAPVSSKTEGGDGRNALYKERSPSTPDKNNQSWSSLSQQVAELRQENGRLQQGWEAERREKDAALHSLRSLQERSCSLQASLSKANQQVSLLNEMRGGGGGGESLSGEIAAPELLSEMAQMRRVIDKLKSMVLLQKDCLVNQSMSTSMRSSMTSSTRDLAPELHCGPNQGHSGGHSWELVNGAASLSSSDPHHRQLQQRSAKTASGDLHPRRDPSVTPPSSVGSGKSVGAQNGATPPLPLKNQTGPPSGPQNIAAAAAPGRNPRGESISRRHSEVAVAAPPGGKTELTRAHTLPQPQAPGALSAWMNTHYQRREQGAVGLNQFLKDTTPPGPTPAPGKMETGGQVVTSRPSQGPIGVQGIQQPMGAQQQPMGNQPMGAQYPPGKVYYPQRQTSPPNQPDSTYDNVAYPTTTAATANTNTQGTIVPSMHILNQSSMTGARVLQSSGVTSPPREICVARDGPGARTWPQEHSDLTQRPHNPTDLELSSPAIRFVNEPTNPETAAAMNLDRKCPVCGQDFSHITMDEFQTHVFECFDDADDPSNNPETMQPQGQRSRANDRLCPMCQKSFAESISQDFFESHVQSHFEDGVDHFELLEMHQT